MQEKGISVNELSKLTGIYRTQLSKYLNGTHEPSHEKMKIIAAALGIKYTTTSPEEIALAMSSDELRASEEWKNSVEEDEKRNIFLKRMLHFYFALSDRDRDRLIERGEELEALADIPLAQAGTGMSFYSKAKLMRDQGKDTKTKDKE